MKIYPNKLIRPGITIHFGGDDINYFIKRISGNLIIFEYKYKNDPDVSGVIEYNVMILTIL
jgi:hypothetical protein